MTDTFWRWRPGRRRLGGAAGPARPRPDIARCRRDWRKDLRFGGATTAPTGVRNLADAYSFDPSTGAWTRLPDLPIAARAWWAVGCAVGRC